MHGFLVVGGGKTDNMPENENPVSVPGEVMVESLELIHNLVNHTLCNTTILSFGTK